MPRSWNNGMMEYWNVGFETERQASYLTSKLDTR
jgi:hypothetical protein